MIKRLDPKATFDIIVESDPSVVKDTSVIAGEKSRYEQYMDTFDRSKLLIEGTPTIFVVRPLTHRENADLLAKWYTFDTVEKKMTLTDRAGMALEVYGLAVLGERLADGTISPIPVEELPIVAVTEAASLVQVISVLGKNLKKA